MAKDDLYFRLRLPEDLKKRVQQAAESSHRSMTTEIIARLEASFTSENALAMKPEILKSMLDQMDDLRARLDKQDRFLASISEEAAPAASTRKKP